MAHDFKKDAALNDRALARYVGGQGTFADPFGNPLLDLLAENGGLDDLRFGALLSPTPLDDLFTHHDEEGRPIPTTPTVTFDQGKPVVHAVSQDPSDGSIREIRTHLDASGAIRQTEETHTTADGLQQITETSYSPLGSFVQVRQEDGAGQVFTAHERITLQIPEAGSTRRIDTLITTNPEGDTAIQLIIRDADGTILATRDAETASRQESGTQQAIISLDNRMSYEVTLYFQSPDEGEEDGEGPAGGPHRAFSRVEVRSVLNDQETYEYATSTGIYHVNGMAEAQSLKVRNGDEIEYAETYHLDGSKTVDEATRYFGGDDVRAIRLTDADGRLVEETHRHKIRNGDYTDTTTIYHADGSTHETKTRQDAQWKTVEIVRTMTHADGSQAIEAETYPNGGKRTAIAHKGADGALIDETVTLLRADGSELVETRTYFPGGFESVAEDRDADGNLTATTDGRRTPTADGGAYFRSVTTEPETTVELTTTHDAEGHLLQDNRIAITRQGTIHQELKTYTPDGSFYQFTYRVTDSAGNVTTHHVETVERDADDVQKSDVVTYYTDGRTTRTTKFQHPERGIFETSQIESHPLPDGGMRIEGTTWEGNFVGPKTESTIVQDAEGARLSVVTLKTDPPNPGETRHEWTPLPGGFQRDEMTHTDPSGTRMVTIETDPDGQQSVSVIARDSAERILREETHRVDADGMTRESIVKVFNSGGGTEVTTTQRDPDGTITVSVDTRNAADVRIHTLDRITAPDRSETETERYFTPDGQLRSESESSRAPDGEVRASIDTIIQRDAAAGDVVQTTTKREDGTHTWLTTTTKDGVVIRRETSDFDETGAEKRQLFSVEADGRIRETVDHFDKDKILVASSGTTRSTDSDGNESIVTFLRANGEKTDREEKRRASDGVLLSFTETRDAPDGSRVHEVMVRSSDTETRVETRQYDQDKVLVEHVIRETTVDPDGVLAITLHTERPAEKSWREEFIRQEADGTVLSRIVTESRRSVDASGNESVERRIQDNGGALLETTEIRDASQHLLEQHSTRTETDEAGVTTRHLVVTRSDASSREEKTLTHPDGLVVEEVFDRASNGATSRVTTRTQDGEPLDTTTVSTYFDAKYNPVQESVIERADGSRSTTLVTQTMGGETRVVTERAADGSEVVSTSATRSDGTQREEVLRKDKAGLTLETRTAETASDGTQTRIVTTPLPAGAIRTETTELAADESLLATVETLTQADGSREETRVTPLPGGTSQTVRTVTDKTGAWVSTQMTTTMADGTLTREESAPRAEGGTRTVFVQEDANGNALEQRESIETITETPTIRTHAVVTTFSSGATRQVLTLSLVNGTIFETTVIETSQDAHQNVLRQRVTKGINGSGTEERTLTSPENVELSYARVETLVGGATRHQTRTRQAHGGVRTEDGNRDRDGQIINWTVVEVVPQGDGSTLTTQIIEAAHATRRIQAKHDVIGNMTVISDVTTTWTYDTATVNLPGGVTQTSEVWRDTDGETELERRIVTTNFDGRKTVETWRQANDNHTFAEYDPGDILRSLTARQTDAHGEKTSTFATYRPDGSLEFERTENRTAGGVLIFTTDIVFYPGLMRVETWEDHSQAPNTHVIVTQKDPHGGFLQSTDTETRRMPDMSVVETVREVHADGRRVEIKTLKTPAGEERRMERTLTHADGTTLSTFREHFADGSTREQEDRRYANGSSMRIVTRTDALGVVTVEKENWASDTENTRLVTVKDANDTLLSETETSKHPLRGEEERIRRYGADGAYTEQFTKRAINGTVVLEEKQVNASGQVLREATTTSRPDDTREVRVEEYDATGKLLRSEARSFIHGDRLKESTETTVRPDGTSVTEQKTIGGITISGSRIVKDAGGGELERSNWQETDTYHQASGSIIKTRKDWHADATIFERREQIGLMASVIEIVETFTDTDGSQIVTRQHNIVNGRLASDGSLVAERWTETVTQKSPTGEVQETSSTTTTKLAGGGERRERLITRADGSSETDFRIVAADETVLEFRTVERTPQPGGKLTLRTDARFQDGRIFDEIVEQDAGGGRTTTARTRWPNGDVRVVESVVAADDTLLSRVDTHTRGADGEKTIRSITNTLHADPQKGTIVELEQVFDASDTLTFETSATKFSNGSRFETTYDTANGETVRAQVEYEADGRRLYGYSETTAAGGRRTIVADKEHIDGSRERIETTLDAAQKQVAYRHTLTDAIGKVHVIDDPHVPAKRTALVGVTVLPVVKTNSGRGEIERTVYSYADGSKVNEEHEYGFWYGTRFHIRHAKDTDTNEPIYRQVWNGNSGLIDKNFYAPSGTRYEAGFGNLKSITVLGQNESEYISWVHDGETHVIRRNPYNKAAFYSGSYASIGDGQTSFRYTSPDGNWEISGIKGRGADHHDAHSQSKLHRSTEIFLDPGAGTKRVIERVPGKDGGNQVADLRYALEPDGTYRRTGATIASTYADKSTVNVEQTYDSQGQLTTEVHRYRSANGNRLVTTTIKHQADGSSTRTAVYTLSGYHSQTETVETRVSGATETVTTRVVDSKNQLTAHTVAVTTNGVQSTTHYQDGRVTKVEIADVTVTTHPDGRLEKIYKTQGSDIVTTLRWGPHGEYAGGSKVVTSSDGSLVTSEIFAPDGNKTITLIEKKDGQITSITTSHVDPYGYVSNVSRTDNLSIADPLAKIAADQLMAKLGFQFLTQPDGSKKIDFSKRVAGVPFTVDGLDFSKVGIDLSKNPIESMTDAFLAISNGNGGADAYAKLIGSLVLTMKDAKANPGVMAGYLAFCGIDMALKETPFGAQWLGIKQELNEYLNIGINAGGFAVVDIPFKFIDDLTGGAATKWLRENGMGNALEALMNPNVLMGSPGEMLTNMARSLATGGAYAPVKLIYNMLPDGVQDMIDDALHQVPGYSQVTYGLGLASGYIDDGVHTGIRYAHRYAEVGLTEAFNAQNYVIAANAVLALSESFAQHATTYANVVGNSFSYAFNQFVDVTEQFGSLIKDIGNQGIAAASRLANSVYGGLKSLANAAADKASDVWNGAKDTANAVGKWLGL